MTSPAASSMPATIAAVWPQLRRNLITLTRASLLGERGVAREGRILAAVVDEDDLEAQPERRDGCDEWS